MVLPCSSNVADTGLYVLACDGTAQLFLFFNIQSYDDVTSMLKANSNSL